MYLLYIAGNMKVVCGHGCYLACYFSGFNIKLVFEEPQRRAVYLGSYV